MAEIRRWRRSAVESFGCPARFKALQIEGIDDTGDEALRGRGFHAAAWVYILRLVAKKLRADYEEAREAFTQGLGISPIPNHLIPETQRLFFRWARRFELDLDAFLSAEELEISDSREFRPDLVYCRPGELEMIDFKTFFKGLTEAQAVRELQPQWYLIEAAKRWPGFDRYRFTFDFVRLPERDRFLSIVMTPEEIAEYEPGIEARIALIEAAETSGDYPALPGSHCRLCRLQCPIVDAPGRLPARYTSVEQAREGFGELLPLTRRRSAVLKALEGWCAKDGPLDLNGEVLAHRPVESRSYRLTDVIDQLRPDQLRRLFVSETALKPVWKADDLPAELKAKAETSISWRFGHVREGTDLDVADDDARD